MKTYLSTFAALIAGVALVSCGDSQSNDTPKAAPKPAAQATYASFDEAIDKELDKAERELNAELDKAERELNQKLDEMEQELDNELDRMESELDAELDSLDF